MNRATGQVPCNREVLISGIQEGRYRLEAWVLNRRQPERERASQTIDLINRNLFVRLALERGADVGGKLVFPSNITSLPTGLHLFVRPVGGALIAGDTPPSIDSKDEFRLINLDFSPQEITLQGLTNGFYIKGMIYNGDSLSDGVLRLNPNAANHSLEIVIGDKPAVITGRVTDRDGAVGKPHVVLVKWPPNSQNMHFSARKIDGDENGSFRFDGLTPGEYRLFSIRPTAQARLNEPNVIEQLVQKARELEAKEDSLLNTNIEVLEF
jgi:hypothetical protein